MMLDILAETTIRNPIFMFVFFGVIWFLPGILLRRLNEAKAKKRKETLQAEKIARLYPKN
ncbi:Hypothetical protein P9211_08101 [Prochlorococcus marinus str. MIT 9211]|uniref:Uncharacterized protein n=1 Tax=Prochlorococcus marinus (strain MIT 9211) TaxID=93059 RepID=A9BA79_PROM4|nr:Hypothetical protein P9211_08101 [Prochlorococcus marinus str. MIT 9211]